MSRMSAMPGAKWQMPLTSLLSDCKLSTSLPHRSPPKSKDLDLPTSPPAQVGSFEQAKNQLDGPARRITGYGERFHARLRMCFPAYPATVSSSSSCCFW